MKKKPIMLLSLISILSLCACESKSVNSIESQENIDSFNEYLNEKKEYLANVNEKDLDNNEKLLLWNATAELNAIKYDNKKSLQENIEAIDSILKEFLEATYDPIGNETLYFVGNFLGIVSFEMTLFPDNTFTISKIFSTSTETYTGTYVYDGKTITTDELGQEIEHMCEKVAFTEKDGRLSLKIVDDAVEMFQVESFDEKIDDDKVNVLKLSSDKKSFVSTDILSMVKPKTDIISILNQKLDFTDEFKNKINTLDETLKNKILNVKSNDELYVEIMSSFRTNGEYVATSTFTSLGSELMEALGYDLLYGNTIEEYGNYSITSAGNSLYNVDVTLNNSNKVHYLYNEETQKIYRNQVFKDEEFRLYGSADILVNSGGNFPDTTWTEGVDGTSYTNVRYGDREREIFDIYIPKELNKTHDNGVYLLIHGGSWTSGSKEDMTNECYYYAKQGYITATLSYTYALTDLGNGKTSGFNTMIDEISMCFEKIKEMSDENGWNIKKAATYGYSSGGHISLLYSYIVGSSSKAVFPSAFAVSFVGPTSFSDDCWDDVNMWGPGIALTGLEVNVNDIFENYYEGADPTTLKMKISQEEFDAYLDDAAPARAAKKYISVPTIGAYSLSDFSIVLGKHGYKLEEALNDIGCENNIYYMPSADHLSGHNPAIQVLFKAKILEYLEKYF